MRRLAIALLAALALTAPAKRPPFVVPWAWERAEDLRFLGEGRTVAWYAGILTLRGDEVLVEPRRNPLRLAMRTHRIAVVRIETKRATLSDAQRRETVAAIARLFREAEELQIDFDAARSERAFYRALLLDVRRTIDAPLTITALASWCMDDRWMRDLPVDEAVPMLFRMGEHAHPTSNQFREPLCRASSGISLDEPLAARPHADRVWVFNPKPWTGDAWRAALAASR